jgi:predicted membrane channel-forming protein YqfA (hemolysin III family)
MPNAQSLAIVLFCILGFCALLALGAFIGKKTDPGKLVTFAGVIALIAVVGYAVYAAYYFITLAQ